MTKELSKIGKHWSKNEPAPDTRNFYMSPVTRAYIIESAFGRDFVDEYRDNHYYAQDIFVSQYLKNKKVGSVLSLCCGFGSIERRLVSKLPGVQNCLGIDIADGALEIARRRAAEEKLSCISYQAVDLNNYFWEEGKYDLVIANGALHHLKNLESVLRGIHRTLKPGGILYCCEYVGPDYQDYPARQLQLINAAAFLVPSELRARRGVPSFLHDRHIWLIARLQLLSTKEENADWPGWKKIIARAVRKFIPPAKDDDFGVVHVSPKNFLLRTDPSECVRSSEIIPVMKQCFPDMEVLPFGGGILQHALDEAFYKNYDHGNPLHVKCLRMLCQLERHLMDTGEIGIENAFIIAHKK